MGSVQLEILQTRDQTVFCFRMMNEADKERYRREKEQYDSQIAGGPVPRLSPEPGLLTCIRSGCEKPSVRNLEWEDEYCSNQCVVLHCDMVFKDWVREQQKNIQ